MDCTVSSYKIAQSHTTNINCFIVKAHINILLNTFYNKLPARLSLSVLNFVYYLYYLSTITLFRFFTTFAGLPMHTIPAGSDLNTDDLAPLRSIGKLLYKGLNKSKQFCILK